MVRDNGKGKHRASGGGKGKKNGKSKARKGNTSSSRPVEQTRTPTPPSSPSPPSSPDQPMRHRARGHSKGHAGKNAPKEPKRVDIHGGHIFDNKAKKTLLGTIRNHWPPGAYSYRDISTQDPEWLENVCDEFKKFYRHQKGQSRSEAQWSIESHAKTTCKRLISDEKRRLVKRRKKTRLSDEDLCPSYFHPDLWDGLLKYWNSEAHKHRAAVGSQNRKKVDTLHSAGAMPFEAHEMEMVKKNNGKKPPLLKVWERTHTTAASRRAREADATRPLVYTSPAAMNIASRYGAILESRGVDLSQLNESTELDEPIELWLRATTGTDDKPKKNRLIGFPTIPAGRLLSNLAHRFRENTRGGASSSSSSANRSPVIPDPMFINIVRNAVTSAQANPDQFGNLNNSDLDEVARNLIEVADPASRGSFNQVFFREVVNVVTTIFTSICNDTQAAIDEANKDLTDEDEDIDENDSGGDDGSDDEDDGSGDDDDGSGMDGEDGGEDDGDREM